MKTENVTEFVVRDGMRFRTEHLAIEYERELDEVEPILSKIPKSKLDHGKYVQHDPDFLMKIKADLWKIVLKQYGEFFPEWKKITSEEVHPLGVVSRVLDDGNGPLAKAWGMLSRFNFKLGREYDQPYFAMHPQEATINKNSIIES